MLILWAENCLGSFSFWVKSFDRANREIGAPGNRFLPLKMGVLWRGGVLSRLKEKQNDANYGFQGYGCFALSVFEEVSLSDPVGTATTRKPK
jgi:hypothetical protein